MASLVEVRSAQSLTTADDRGRNAELLALVRAAGLMDRNPAYYGWCLAADWALLVLGWVAFVLVGRSWWQLGVAVVLGVAFTRIGFLGHDAGHRQVFRSRRGNDMLGLLATNVAIGLSFGWWVDKHRRHHLNPNHEGLDPDIENKVVAFCPRPAAGRGRLARLAVRFQVPVICLAIPMQATALHLKSALFLARRGSRHRALEILGLTLHLAVYAGLVATVLDPPRAFVFVLVQQGVFGTCFALVAVPNHTGLPIVRGAPRADFVWRQVVTARDIDGGWLVDYLYGGLNHQIEHHLFPSMPRRALRGARPLVAEFCRSHDIPYAHTSALESYRQAFGYLHDVARMRIASASGQRTTERRTASR
ncbi:Fatty acid desaturase [Frankia canadensis]|uniref:Fatty acid desaturase n=1 Tax=Frankia canadensis TaxID=1836972 RepID=A0A2I2L299_9ACTN|nr:acyl-CoA desaturase [Frankia canadensis]SNQ52053.1 Fatty acid desaturase [Frankia canadensis]SOU59343.1 Fatty acid desaturase [Frankia canadensis]